MQLAVEMMAQRQDTAVYFADCDEDLRYLWFIHGSPQFRMVV